MSAQNKIRLVTDENRAETEAIQETRSRIEAESSVGIGISEPNTKILRKSSPTLVGRNKLDVEAHWARNSAPK